MFLYTTTCWFGTTLVTYVTCDNAFTTTCWFGNNLVTSVTCDLPHYTGAIPLTGSFFGRGNAPILIHNMMCTGYESSLEQCSNQTLSPSSSSYLSSPVASVICQGNTTTRHECRSGDLRLGGGQSENEGRVEVCVEGFWGTVCDGGWGQREAVVVCRQSGFGAKGRKCCLL